MDPELTRSGPTPTPTGDPPNPFLRLARNAYRLATGGDPVVLQLCLYYFLVIGVFILARILRDALLLELPSADGVGRLPLLIAVSAGVVGALAYLYGKYATRFRYDRMMVLTNGVLALTMGLLYLLLRVLPSTARPLLLQINYVHAEVLGAVLVLQFWTFAPELFDLRQAKRAFAIIGGGAVLAQLLAFGVRPMIKLVAGPQDLIPGLAVVLALSTLVIVHIGRTRLADLPQGARQRQVGQQPKIRAKVGQSESLWGNHLVRNIAGIVLLTTCATTIVDYQFKALAAEVYGKSAALANFFGTFYGSLGIVAVVLQFGVASRMLRRLGIQPSLLVLPVLLFVSSLILGSAPLLFSVVVGFTMAKGSDNALRYTINNLSYNLLYGPLSWRLRRRARAMIHGIVKPLAIGLGAGLIAVFSAFGSAQQLSWVSLGLVLLWIALVVRSKRWYVASLVTSMQQHQLGIESNALALQEPQTVAVILKTLENENPVDVLHALDLIPHLSGHRWIEPLTRLLARDDDQIRIKAMEVMRQMAHPFALDASEEPPAQTMMTVSGLDPRIPLVTLINDQNPAVAGRAIEVYCALVGQEALVIVKRHLESDVTQLRESAIVGILEHCGLDGVVLAGTRLQQLIEDPEPQQRLGALRVLDRLVGLRFYSPILTLIADPDPTVQRMAFALAGKVRSPRLVRHLVDALGVGHIRSAAMRALVRYGPAVLGRLDEALARHQDPLLRHALVTVIGRIGTQRAVDLLVGRLKIADRALRAEILPALGRVLSKSPALRPAVTGADTLLSEALQHLTVAGLDSLAVAQAFPANRLLRGALRDEIESTIASVFGCLSLLHPPRKIQLALDGIASRDKARVTKAMELLDNLLAHPVKQVLFPVLESDSAAMLRIGRERFGLELASGDALLTRLAQHWRPWMRACVLWSISRHRLQPLSSCVMAAVEDPSPLVRETALLALKPFVSRLEYLALAQRLAKDDAPSVARFAQNELSRNATIRTT